MFCSKCGNQMTDDSKFCPQCGTPVYYASEQKQKVLILHLQKN